MSEERKAVFEVEPYWYVLDRDRRTVSELQGFKDIESFMAWIYGKKVSADAHFGSLPQNFLDLGAGEGRVAYDLVKASYTWLMPLNVYGYDKYILPKEPFQCDPDVFDRVVKNWIKDDFTNLPLHYSPDYFGRIVSSCAFGLYAESEQEFEKQLSAVKCVLAKGGLFRFQLAPARGRYIDNPNYRGRNYEPEMVLDPTNYNIHSDFLVETPFERFKYYKLKCLKVIQELGLDCSIYTSVDWSSDYRHRNHYITCELTK